VNRFYLLNDSSEGKYFRGTVSGPATKKGALVAIEYDNGDLEDQSASELAGCIVEKGSPLPRRGRPPAAVSPGPKLGAVKASAKPVAVALAQAAPPAALPTPALAAATTPVAKRKASESVAPSPRKGTPGRKSTNPNKRFVGTTQDKKTGLWSFNYKGYTRGGFVEEEEAARGWDEAARSAGRFDNLNVYSGAAAAAAARKPEEAPQPKRAKVNSGASPALPAKAKAAVPMPEKARTCVLM